MSDLPERLRKQAAWLESRSFAVLHGTIEREAAREIERLRAELAKVKADYQRYVDAVDAAEHAEIERLRDGLSEQAELWGLVREELDALDARNFGVPFMALYDPIGKANALVTGKGE